MTNEEKIIVQLATPERISVNIYLDFLYNKILSTEEKMMFIALKSFVNFKLDSNNRGFSKQNVFPTMETLCTITSLTKPRATRTIKGLITKGFVEKIRRGLNKSNIYTLSDNARIWACESIEEVKNIKNQEKIVNLENIPTELLLKELKKRNKEKGLASDSDQTTETSTSNKSSYRKENTPETEKSQEAERYSINQIRQLFDYDIMVHDHPDQKQDIDSVMNILYDAINTTKETIRISGEDKPQMVVTSRLMKLTHSGVMYVIGKYKEQTQRIKNPSAYMLTLLYNAEEQMNLDIANQVAYNMAHWGSNKKSL